MAIPPRHIPHELPTSQLNPADDIFQDLVERMSDMQLAIRIGRAIVEDEALRRLSVLLLPGIEIISATFQVLRLFGGRYAGRECGLGKFQGRRP